MYEKPNFTIMILKPNYINIIVRHLLVLECKISNKRHLSSSDINIIHLLWFSGDTVTTFHMYQITPTTRFSSFSSFEEK